MLNTFYINQFYIQEMPIYTIIQIQAISKIKTNRLNVITKLKI